MKSEQKGSKFGITTGKTLRRNQKRSGKRDQKQAIDEDLLDIVEEIKTRRNSSAQPTREEEETHISKQKKQSRKRQMKNDKTFKKRCLTSDSEEDVINPIERITVNLGPHGIDYLYRRFLEMKADSYTEFRSNFDRLLLMDYAYTQSNRDQLYTRDDEGFFKKKYKGNFWNIQSIEHGRWIPEFDGFDFVRAWYEKGTKISKMLTEKEKRHLKGPKVLSKVSKEDAATSEKNEEVEEE